MTAADAYIDSLELFGMQFGLERMHALLDRLGNPERAFDAIHVVGTNGKSSTTRFAEALLLAEGVTAGAYLSPHLTSFQRADPDRRAPRSTRPPTRRRCCACARRSGRT